MSWPGRKGGLEVARLKHLLPEQRERALAEKKRLKDLNLCAICKERQRYSTQTICLQCHNDRRIERNGGSREKVNQHRRLVAQGLCYTCKERPRSEKYRSYCLECGKAVEKKSFAKIRRVSGLEFVDKVMKRHCLRCRQYLNDPLTKKGRPRFVCLPCYRELWATYRIFGGTKPFTTIRELIREAKIRAGIMPLTAWVNKGPRDSNNERIHLELRRMA